MKKFTLPFLLFLAFACGSAEKDEKEAQDTTLPKEVGEKSASPAEQTAKPKMDFSTFLGKRFGLEGIDAGTGLELLEADEAAVKVRLSYEGEGPCIWTQTYTALALDSEEKGKQVYAIHLDKPQLCEVHLLFPLDGTLRVEVKRITKDCGEMPENCLNSQGETLYPK